MPNIKGLTGDLELPEFEKPWRYDKGAIPCGVLFEESCGRRAVIDDTSATFAMICAGMWWPQDGIHNAEALHHREEMHEAWMKEAAARLEAERKVG